MTLITGMATYYNEIGMVLQQWANLGIFSYILPFLLIFAVVMAILQKLPMFADQKGIAVLVAVSIGLLALQFELVPLFFSELFPKVGVGVAIIVVSLILMGAFLDQKKDDWQRFVFFGIGAVIFIAVVMLSFTSYRFMDSWWWQQYGSALIAGLVLVVIIIIAMSAHPKGGNPQ